MSGKSTTQMRNFCVRFNFFFFPHNVLLILLIFGRESIMRFNGVKKRNEKFLLKMYLFTEI